MFDGVTSIIWPMCNTKKRPEKSPTCPSLEMKYSSRVLTGFLLPCILTAKERGKEKEEKGTKKVRIRRIPRRLTGEASLKAVQLFPPSQRRKSIETFQPHVTQTANISWQFY